jgi:SM-20-related protein
MNQWEEKDGGCLRLYPPIDGTDEYEILDIPPIAGTCALFLSGAMDHEVLPSYSERVAIAAWYS